MKIPKRCVARPRALLLAGAALVFVAGTLVLVPHHDGAAKSTTLGTKADTLQLGVQDIARAQRDPAVRPITVSGTLSPLEQAVVRMHAPGVLASVLVREGQTVAKGELLARIDDTEARALLAARQAEFIAARAQLARVNRALEQQRDLLDKGFISVGDFEAVKNEETVARAQLDAARAQTAQAQRSLRDRNLISPIAGVVAQRHAEPGERLPAQAPVVSVMALEKLEFFAGVPAASIAKVTVGQAVSVRVEGFAGHTFEGQVKRIHPSATPGTRMVPVYVGLDNPQQILRAGLFAHGDLVLSTAQKWLTIPASAVREDAGRRFVYTVEDGRVRKRAVDLAYVDGMRAVVRDGLAEGTPVVVVDLGPLIEGAPARLPARRTTGVSSVRG